MLYYLVHPWWVMYWYNTVLEALANCINIFRRHRTWLQSMLWLAKFEERLTQQLSRIYFQQLLTLTCSMTGKTLILTWHQLPNREQVLFKLMTLPIQPPFSASQAFRS